MLYAVDEHLLYERPKSYVLLSYQVQTTKHCHFTDEDTEAP